MKHFKNINLAALILVGAVLALGVLFGVIAFPKESLAGLSFVGFAFGTVYTEGKYTDDIVLHELGMQASREQVVVLSGQNLVAGTVVGKAIIGGVTETHAGNTGNGVLTPDATTPALANCQTGVYTAKCTAAATNAGTFRVTDPKGNVLGDYTVATAAFANQIKFAIADGATDFIVGDTFLITVAVGTNKVKILTPAALDGTQTAFGVTFDDYDGTSADVPGVIVCREAVLKDDNLTWPGGITQAQKDAAIAQLLANHITLRNTA